mmetsp:Transcript_16824/g.25296  ORF Transcript_16824/g.25296 Transcript_16824/m.25296 type:complete len:96 (-) Transcript_16824:281-568(-)
MVAARSSVCSGVSCARAPNRSAPDCEDLLLLPSAFVCRLLPPQNCFILLNCCKGVVEEKVKTHNLTKCGHYYITLSRINEDVQDWGRELYIAIAL